MTHKTANKHNVQIFNFRFFTKKTERKIENNTAIIICLVRNK